MNLLHIYCTVYVIANTQLYFSFTCVCKSISNENMKTAFTSFAHWANVVQISPNLLPSKYEIIWAKAVFIIYLLQVCYPCKSIFRAVTVFVPIPLPSFLVMLWQSPWPTHLPAHLHFEYWQKSKRTHFVSPIIRVEARMPSANVCTHRYCCKWSTLHFT